MGLETTVGARAGSRVPTAASQRGAVTAEAALVLPVLVGLALGLVWLVSLAATQVRVVDGAREAVRVAARGESTDRAFAQGSQVAPAGTTFHLERSGGVVRVRATATVRGPGGLFGFLPGVQVRSEAVAAEEPR